MRILARTAIFLLGIAALLVLLGAAMKKNTTFIEPVDRLLRLQTPGEFSSGAFVNTGFSEEAGGVVLAPEGTGAARKGQYVSSELPAGFLFKELIPSCNISCPPGCGFLFELRVRGDEGPWSSWLSLGGWGVVPRQKAPLTRDKVAAVKVDYLVAPKGATTVQFRLSLYSKNGEATPVIRLITAACSSERGDRDLPLRSRAPASLPLTQWNRTLPVPFRSQTAEESSIAGHICSPTSVSMVMEYWGVSLPTKEVAALLYDSSHKMYGIWWRAVEGASQYGFEGWVQCFRNWEQVKEWIARDTPVIACVSFGAGELGGSMTPQSEGHVMVIRGFDKKGNPLCNDPAGADEDRGSVTYDREEFAKAWFDRGGVGYLIRPLYSP
ncbi:MAG: C39 family peptidase [Candidatus Eremiobacteraeota bacterium]|nr:C39 family peptidase [Candidatus Eremiobacteraeota bacterium]